MKAFHFSLASVLSLRTYQEGEALMEWGRAEHEVKSMRRVCQEIQEELSRWQCVRREQQLRYRVTAQEMMQSDRMAHQYHSNLVSHQRLLQSLEHKSQLAFQKWQLAHRKMEILDRLKARKLNQWTKDFDADEQKQMDERASSFTTWRNSRN